MASIFTGHVEGPIDSDAIVYHYIANAAIAQWAPVIQAAAGTGEDYLRVAETTTAGSVAVMGVKVAPSKTLVAADIAAIIVHGRSKVKMLDAVVRDDVIETSATTAKAQKQVATTVSATPTGTEVTNALKQVRSGFGHVEAISGTVADGDDIVAYINRLAYKR